MRYHLKLGIEKQFKERSLDDQIKATVEILNLRASETSIIARYVPMQKSLSGENGEFKTARFTFSALKIFFLYMFE